MRFNAVILSLLSVGFCEAFVQNTHHGRNVASSDRNTDFRLGSSSASSDTSAIDATLSSSSVYTGAGPALVDMNMYNLPLERIAEEWTATLVSESSMQAEGVYLRAKSDADVMVDNIRVDSIPRKSGQGLGIELLEIAGGREDGLGITVVNGIVEGGVCESSGIQPGDSIVKIAIWKGNEEVAAVGTECLGYDATVDAIVGLPIIQSEDETFVITVKRLRTKPKVTLTLQYPPEQNEPDVTFELFSGENLRRAMLVRGVKLNDPLSKRFDSGGIGDCGAEGTCATCTVSVVKGGELLNGQKDTEEQIFRNKPRWRMACKAIVGHGMKSGEMIVKVNPRQWEEE